ncbi:MAG: YdcF family protein [Pseudomonadota bacterium]
MFRRILSGLFLVWALGFLWFTVSLPAPAGEAKTDAVIVPTGGAGRIAQGLSVMDDGLAKQMLVSGVDRDVTPEEFAIEFEVDETRMECCVTLGFSAIDTRTNATESAQWVETNDVETVRLVTSDWHMRRAAGELDRMLPAGVTVVQDAVPTEPSLWTLFLEYNKLIASTSAGLINI